MIALITYGLRTSFGLFATPISEGRGWSPEVFALAIAIQNIVWGLGQPFAGAVADRYGSARILAAGQATEEELKAVDKEVRDIVNAAADFAVNDPEPDPSELYTDILL